MKKLFGYFLVNLPSICLLGTGMYVVGSDIGFLEMLKFFGILIGAASFVVLCVVFGTKLIDGE